MLIRCSYLLILLALVCHGNRPDREVQRVVDADARDGREQRHRILDGDGGEGKPCVGQKKMPHYLYHLLETERIINNSIYKYSTQGDPSGRGHWLG